MNAVCGAKAYLPEWSLPDSAPLFASTCLSFASARGNRLRLLLCDYDVRVHPSAAAGAFFSGLYCSPWLEELQMAYEGTAWKPDGSTN